MLEMNPSRRVRACGRLAAVVMLVGALALAGEVVAAGSKKTVVKDGRTSIEEGCDIREATSKRTDDGRLRHTITLQLGTSTFPHSVAISRSRSGGIDYVLRRGGEGVHVHLANGGRTVVFLVGRGRVASAVDSQEKYFWVARSCSDPGDRAPNPGEKARQSL
jgi:hypothetical protein